MADAPVTETLCRVPTDTGVRNVRVINIPTEIAADPARTVQDVVLAGSNDWEQLFINGVSVADGHNLNPSAVLSALGVPYRTIWYMEGEVKDGTAHPQTLTEADIEGHLVTRDAADVAVDPDGR